MCPDSSIARHNFDSFTVGNFLNVAKFDVVQQEGPNVVTKSVRFQFACLVP